MENINWENIRQAVESLGYTVTETREHSLSFGKGIENYWIGSWNKVEKVDLHLDFKKIELGKNETLQVSNYDSDIFGLQYPDSPLKKISFSANKTAKAIASDISKRFIEPYKHFFGIWDTYTAERLKHYNDGQNLLSSLVDRDLTEYESRDKKINFKSRFYDYNEVALTYDNGFNFELKNIDLATAKKIIDFLK